MADHEEPHVSTTDSLEHRLAAAVERQGNAVTVRRAATLLAGGYEGEDFLRVVGGEHAEGILSGAPALYWPELWGARALLYVWDDTADSAVAAVIAGLANRSWRVREMSLRVSAARSLVAASELVPLTRDEHPRVRAAAARAIAVLGDEVSDAGTLEAMLRDPDKEVRRAAQQSLTALRGR